METVDFREILLVMLSNGTLVCPVISPSFNRLGSMRSQRSDQLKPGRIFCWIIRPEPPGLWMLISKLSSEQCI